MLAWRLARAVDRSTAFSGVGSFKYGGRWSSAGRYVVYASLSLATAALEVLVHAGTPGAIPHDMLAIKVVVPDDLPTTKIRLGELPPDWREPDHPACRRIGDAWLDRGRTAILIVPSAVVPQEKNLVINARHPSFARIDTRDPGTAFRWDRRLISFLP